jgi:glycosyltransferase involved in cell wall biosynthesis
MRKSAERSVAVVIPSRLEKSGNGKLFVEEAIEAAGAQVIPFGTRISFFVGIDSDALAPASLDRLANVNFVQSHGRSQAAAINAAATVAAQSHDVIALLEDDDRWEPNFLAWSLSFLDECDFVSSNQLEIDAEGRCIRVNDFPTPSGWIMATDLWRSVGVFDESFRWHLDNEWLGRLGFSHARRIHLVEATAPITIESCAQVRPWIANVLTLGGPHSTVRRHLSSQPLLRRTVHPGSGMFRIATNPVAAAESQNEYRHLVARYGRVPW